MRLFNRIDKNHNHQALKSVGGDLGFVIFSETLADLQKHDAVRRAHQIGVIAGEIIEVDFETGQRFSYEIPEVHPSDDDSFRHVSIVHPELFVDHEIS